MPREENMNYLEENIRSCSLKSEQSIIGIILVKGYPVKKVSWLKPKDFYFLAHQTIWRAILKLYEAGKPITMVSVFLETFNDKYKKESIAFEYCDCLAQSVLPYYEHGIVDMAKEIRNRSVQKDISEGKRIDKSLLEQMFIEEESTEIENIGSLVTNEIKGASEGLHLKNLGYSTGFLKVDKFIGGIKGGELIIIAGRPGMGKTTWALNLAVNLAKQKVKTLYINLEMTLSHIARKIIAAESDIDGNAFSREFSELEVKKSFNLVNEMTNNKLSLDILDKGKISVDEIRKILVDNNYQAVFIDQLTKVKHESKRQRYDLEVAEITFGLKAMAKELNLPVFLLHQINRQADYREDKRPNLSDLRDAGCIEQDGDLIFLIYRNDYYTGENNGEAMINLAKNKMGSVSDMKFVFYPEYSKFAEKEVGYEPMAKVSSVQGKFGIEKSIID